MAELTTRTQPNASKGDTFNGEIIKEVINAANGFYAWRNVESTAAGSLDKTTDKASDSDIDNAVADRYIDAEHLKTQLDKIKDSASEWKPNTDYTTDENLFRFTTANTTSVDVDGTAITPNETHFGEYRVPQISSATLTNAEMAKIKLVSDPNLLNVDIATDADVIANTAGKLLDATRILDEENFDSDSAVHTPAQKNVKVHFDRIEAFEARKGWFRIGGQLRFNTGTTRTLSMDTVEYTRFNLGTHTEDDLTYPLADPITFDIYSQTGLLTAAQTVVPNAYDVGGVETTLPSGQETAGRFFQDPVSGTIAYLLGQVLHTTGAETLKKFATDPLVIPPELANYEPIGALIISAGQNNFQTNNNTGLLMASEYGSFTQGGSSVSEVEDVIVANQVAADTTSVQDGQRIQIGRGATYVGTYQNISGVTALATTANLADANIFQQLDIDTIYKRLPRINTGNVDLEVLEQPDSYYINYGGSTTLLNTPPHGLTGSYGTHVKWTASTAAGTFGYLQATFVQSGQPVKKFIIGRSSNIWGDWVDVTSTSVDEITPAQAISTTGVDYTAFGTWSAERADEWGQSRRVQRIFRVTGAFDYTTLGYADKTAIYVRNEDSSNGINYTYRTDNTVTLDAVGADGKPIVSVNDVHFFNVQPNEIVFAEKDGNVFRASIIPAERVKNFVDATDANAFGALPHDAIVTTRDGLIGWRKSGFNNELFPVDGVTNDHWFIVGGSNVVFNGDNGAITVGKKNFYYSDETVPTIDNTIVGTKGQEFVIARASYPSGSDATTQLAGAVSETLYTRDTDEWVVTEAEGQSLGSPITSVETTLIDVDGSNNTLYPFSNGDTYGQIKAKFPRFRIDLSASDSGVNRVARLSMTMTPAQLEETLSQSGGLLANYNGVLISINVPTDTDTGFTYKQSSGDNAAGGRMQFTVTGLRDGILINNAESAVAGTYQLRKNADGTFDLV